MYNKFGISLYLSSFDTQREMLEKFLGSGYYVFTSFHIQEEFDSVNDYKHKAFEMCKWLKVKGFKIVGDVSPKTLKFFEYNDVIQFAYEMGLDVLRLDYGFSDDEILNIAKEFPLSFNASTVNEQLAKSIMEVGTEVFALHNFYPRPETGLDEDLFKTINNRLKNLGIKVLAFIPGDEVFRGPIYEGLPTLEKHRRLSPYIAFLDLAINYGIETIFVGDIQLSDKERSNITNYLTDGIITVPVQFHPDYAYLYQQVFTIRIDSPHVVLRLQESREYSCHGDIEQPFNCINRDRGVITMDNRLYKRYSGEIQIVRESLKEDERVNVIGTIDMKYLSILECIKNGKKIRFIE